MIKRQQRFGYFVLMVPFLKFFAASLFRFISTDDLFRPQRVLSVNKSFWIAVVYLVVDIWFDKSFQVEIKWLF